MWKTKIKHYKALSRASLMWKTKIKQGIITCSTSTTTKEYKILEHGVGEDQYNVTLTFFQFLHQVKFFSP